MNNQRGIILEEYYFDNETGHEYMINGDCWEDCTTGEYGLFNKNTGTGYNAKTGESFLVSGDSFETDSGRSGLINPQSTDYSYKCDSSTSSTKNNLSSASYSTNGNAELFSMLYSTRHIKRPQSKLAKVMIWLFIKIPVICYFLFIIIYMVSIVLQKDI